jgi:plasmid stability protein
MGHHPQTKNHCAQTIVYGNQEEDSHRRALSCYHDDMAQLLVRHLEDDVKLKIQRRALRHGRSTEEEVREILRNAVKEEGGVQAGIGSRLAARFAGLGLTQDIPELRGEEARPADLEP